MNGRLQEESDEEMKDSDMSAGSEDVPYGCFDGSRVEAEACRSCGEKDIVSNNSNEEKRFFNTPADRMAMEGQQLQKKQKPGKTLMEEPDSASGASDRGCATGNSELSCGSGDKNGSGSSGKRRRTRWGLHGGNGIGEHIEGNTQRRKRRKSRWACFDSQIKLLGPLELPDFMKEDVLASEIDLEVVNLKAELADINKKLRNPVLDDLTPLEERSPSPEPVYNNLGCRINTREIRLREKMTQTRQQMIAKLIQKQPTFKPPASIMVNKLSRKLYVPVKQYPDYNFIGLIIGPRGNTQKRMEKETGAKISLRGVGLGSRQSGVSDYDDLHVYVEADDQDSLNAAVKMVEKLLVPMDEGTNAHKQAQLQELVALKQTSPVENKSSLSGVQGYEFSSCPHRPPTSPPVSSNHNLRISLPQSNANNLYVGYLPSSVDYYHLKELFGPFGKLVEAKVTKGHSTGNSRGYGFVKFANLTDADLSVSHLKGFKMESKTLAVRYAGHTKAEGASTPVTDTRTERGQTGWPGPPGSQLLEPDDSSSPSSGVQTDWPGPPGSQLPGLHDQWPGPPGSLLLQTEPVSSHLSTSGAAWPGPRGSLLPEPQSSRGQSPFFLPSDPPGRSPSFDDMPSCSSWLSNGRSPRSWNSSSLVSEHVSFSSCSPYSVFPGDPGFPGSKTCSGKRELKTPPGTDISHTPESSFIAVFRSRVSS